MKIKLSREMKIGIFFILILFAAFVVLNFLKSQNILTKNSNYYIVYEDVDGLTPTSHVFMKGLKIGSIESIKFNDNTGQFFVKINIKNNYRIPQYSTAEIFSTDIMGNRAIRIIYSKETEYLHSGDTLLAGAATGLMATLSDELIPLKNKIDTLVTSLNVTIGALNNVLNTETQTNLVAAIASLRQSLHNLQQLSSTLIKEQGTIKNILQNTDKFIAEIQKSGKNITKTMEHLSQFTDSLRSTDIKTTVDNLNIVLQQVNNQNGSIGKLLHDDTFYNNVTKAIAHLDSLIVAIQKNPKKYIKISIF
jgi:phospholipid/cholesterol/gamma-HCH transport system substrate-binding protein